MRFSSQMPSGGAAGALALAGGEKRIVLVEGHLGDAMECGNKASEDVPSPISVFHPFVLPRMMTQSSHMLGLRLECAELFDEARHDHLLRDLWHRAFPHEAFSRFSVFWEVLGFQSDDPVRDLRGARALGLKHLVHFCSGGNFEVVRHSRLPFPLAAVSLNVTLMLCSHLGLLAMPARGTAAAPHCSDEVLRNFIRLHAATSSQFGVDTSASTSPAMPLMALMHEQCLRWLFHRWQKLSRSHAIPGRRRIMSFPIVLGELRTHLQHVLDGAQAPWSLGSILVALRQQGIDDLSRDFDQTCERRKASLKQS
mmetsp:Transcript_36678/g.91355  ORF Transcript_36678/g.91355 Transcript_36678/m.91355 type:complete len:310 (+) Transcript_36678:24-953(+)